MQIPADFLLVISPQPSQYVRDRIADGQQRCRTHKCRTEIGNLKTPVRHFENASDQWYRSAQRAEEAPDEYAGNAPLFHKGLAARNELGMARQRPHMCDRIFKLEPDPIGQ